jgi:hypothetical protein
MRCGNCMVRLSAFFASRGFTMSHDSEFLVRFPVHIVVVGAVKTETGGIRLGGVHYVGDETGKRCVAVFTDDDTAKSHCRDAGLLDAQIGTFSKPAEFLKFLEYEKSRGATHVAFDPYIPARKAIPVAIDSAIETVRGLPGRQ